VTRAPGPDRFGDPGEEVVPRRSEEQLIEIVPDTRALTNRGKVCLRKPPQTLDLPPRNPVVTRAQRPAVYFEVSVNTRAADGQIDRKGALPATADP
jgi:hypothetical protein